MWHTPFNIYDVYRINIPILYTTYTRGTLCGSYSHLYNLFIDSSTLYSGTYCSTTSTWTLWTKCCWIVSLKQNDIFFFFFCYIYIWYITFVYYRPLFGCIPVIFSHDKEPIRICCVFKTFNTFLEYFIRRERTKCSCKLKCLQVASTYHTCIF